MTTLVRARIVHDASPESPRTWDNFGTLVLLDDGALVYEDEQHREHTLRDVNGVGVRRLAHEHMRGVRVAARVELPSSMVDRSAVDGFLYATRADVVREYGAVNAETVAKARAVLTAEAETWRTWADGDVYGYIIERRVLCALCEALTHTELGGCDECGREPSAHDEASGHDYAPTYRKPPTDCPHCDLDGTDSLWGNFGHDVDQWSVEELSPFELELLKAEADAGRIEYETSRRIESAWKVAA